MQEERPSLPTHLAVAEIVAPWGLAGDIKARILTDFPERFRRGLAVCIGERKSPSAVVRSRLLQKGFLVLKLEGIDTAEAANKLRGEIVYVERKDAPALADGEYFWYQIIGLRVRTVAGEELGAVEDILITGANDVYVVRGPRGEVLIPALDDVVRRIDLDAGLMVVELPEGLL